MPVRGPAGEPQLDPAATLEALRPMLENADDRKSRAEPEIRHGRAARRPACKWPARGSTRMVASYLLDAGERNHNLDELAQRYLHHADHEDRGADRHGQEPEADGRSAAGADHALRGRRCRRRLAAAADSRRAIADGRARHSCSTTSRCRWSKCWSSWNPTASEIDTELLARLEREVRRAAGAGSKSEIYDAGRPRVQHRLAQAIAADSVRRTKAAGAASGPRRGGSTDADVLEELARLHPLPAKIIEYRQYAKLKNTYVDALPQMVHPQTGRVHASFNQVVAATGRLSSHDPNLQNIPVRNESGREIRAAFLPGPAAGTAGGRLLADRAAGAGPLFAGSRRCAGPSSATRTSTPAWPARSTACRWRRSPARCGAAPRRSILA